MIAERAADFGEIGTENYLVNFLSVHLTNPYSADGRTMHNKSGGVYHQGDENLIQYYHIDIYSERIDSLP